MKILIATHYWRPHKGGIEVVAWEQARRLAAAGHQISLITSAVGGPAGITTDSGIIIHRVPAWNYLEEAWGIPYPIFHWRLAAVAARLVTEADVVLVHSHLFLSSLVTIMCARREKKPVVLLQHSPFVKFRFPWNVIEALADKSLGRLALNMSDSLVAPSRHTARYVNSLVPHKPVAVLANAVDLERFTPLPPEDKMVVREELGLPAGMTIVLTVRRLVYRNGLDVLLDAARSLRAEANLLFVIVGGGPDDAKLRRFIGAHNLVNCRLAGQVRDEALGRYYQAADIFVLPTRTGEGFGLVLLEAAASGLSIIATSGGAQEEVVREGDTGLLVSPGDPTALAQALLLVGQKTCLRRRLAERARIGALSFDWQQNVSQLTNILRSARLGMDVKAP